MFLLDVVVVLLGVLESWAYKGVVLLEFEVLAVNLPLLSMGGNSVIIFPELSDELFISDWEALTTSSLNSFLDFSLE